MSATATIEVDGHIIDSLILAKILDTIVDAGADYQIVHIDVGRRQADPSHARIEITAPDEESLLPLLTDLLPHGAHPVVEHDAVLRPADTDGVFPRGFYATTNLPTSVRVEGHWLDAEPVEMDCGIVVRADRVAAVTTPMHRVHTGDLVVVGSAGVRVRPLEKPRAPTAGLVDQFAFMTSEISSEKPKGLIVSRVAERISHIKAEGGKLLAVCGPAVIHTGAGPDLARMIRERWVDVLFAGNGFATHDIESALLGTSLGVSITEGTAAEGGHANHLRAINEVRRWGSIANGVDDGELGSGVLYECVRAAVPYVLAGSVRDDGPLPDVITDMVEAQDEMRRRIDGVRVALMLSSTLHAIATGNILPATVETFCVDINQAVVTKLADRGSHQVLGIVTDVGLFVRELASRLCR